MVVVAVKGGGWSTRWWWWCSHVGIYQQIENKKTHSKFFFGCSIWAQLLMPTGSSLEMVRGEGAGCGVVVVV
jgi:hypothetical protein